MARHFLSRAFIPAILGVVCLLSPARVRSQTPYPAAYGFCEVGKTQIITSAIPSTTYAQGSFPACTVTVYNHSTVTLSTIFSDSSGTPLGNPFTASSTSGLYQFFAAQGDYDIKLSGAGIPTPLTISGVTLSNLSASPTLVNATLSGTTTNTGTIQGGAINPATITSTSPAITPTSIEQVRYADQFAGADICAKANAAIANLPSTGGLVVIPTGSYACNAQLSIPSKVQVVGQGSQATILTFSIGGDEVLLNGTEFAGLHNIGIVLPASTAAVAVHLEASTPQTCVYNDISDVDINAPSLFSGQYGVKLDGNSCVFNSIHHLTIRETDQPIVSTGSSEGNHFYDLQLSTFAASNGGAGIYANGADDQIHQVRCSLGSSTANPIYCMNINAADVQAVDIFADLGSHGTAVTGSGAAPQFWAGIIGSTNYGTVTGGYLNSLGRDRDASAYEVNAISTTGANRLVFQAGMASFSNGFTEEYQDSPQAIRYALLGGPVGIGLVPSFSDTYSLKTLGNVFVGGSILINGGAALATSNQTGTGSIVMSASPTLTGTITAATLNATTLQQDGAAVALASQLPLTGTVTITASSTALAAVTGTASITGATTAMACVASAAGTRDPDAFPSQCWVSAAGTVTVEVTTRVTDASPGAIVYSVRVIQ